MLRILRSVGAVVVGYATLVVGALIFQDALFGRITHESSPVALIVGGGMTAVAAVLGGYLLAWIAPARPLWHTVPLVLWLCVETVLVHFEFGFPLWFDLLAGGSAIAGILLGAVIRVRRSGAHPPGAPQVTSPA